MIRKCILILLVALEILCIFQVLGFQIAKGETWVEIGRWTGITGFTGTGYFRTNHAVWRVRWNVTLSSGTEFSMKTYEDGELEEFAFLYRYGPTNETNNVFEINENTAAHFPYIHDSIGIFHIDVIILGEGSYSGIIEEDIDSIPEFPSFLILPLFMIATLLAVIVYRRKCERQG